MNKEKRTSLFSLSAGALDPFQSLAVDSSRLQTLLGNCRLCLVLKSCFGDAYNTYFSQS